MRRVKACFPNMIPAMLSGCLKKWRKSLTERSPDLLGNSVFSKIIRDEIPSYKVFENDHVVAFLARDAIHLGHTLVIPKIEVDYFIDVPEPYYSRLARLTPLRRV